LENEIKVRKLKAGDVHDLAAIIGKVAIKSGQIPNLLAGLKDKTKKGKEVDAKAEPFDATKTKSETEDSGDIDKTTLGIQLFGILLFEAKDEIEKWFADLVGLTPQQYQELEDFSAPVKIINQLVAKPEFGDFLAQAKIMAGTLANFMKPSTK